MVTTVPKDEKNMLLNTNESFFEQNTVHCAKSMIGSRIVHGELSGTIIETEAYRGSDDAASHAFKGPTNRSKVMFGRPGVIYVYLVYGMHCCMNITTETEGNPGAVLLRAILDGPAIINGPGRLCRFLNIDRRHNGVILKESTSIHFERHESNHLILSSTRIGISRAKDKPWRFMLKETSAK
jgi:DNA-3-methyladenine glycosylase